MSQMSIDRSQQWPSSQLSIPIQQPRPLTKEQSLRIFKWTEIYKVAYERSRPGKEHGKGPFEQGQLVHVRPSTKITLIDSKGRRLVDTYRRRDEADQRNALSYAHDAASSEGTDAMIDSKLKRKRDLDGEDTEDDESTGSVEEDESHSVFKEPWGTNVDDYYFTQGTRLTLPEGYNVQITEMVDIYKTANRVPRTEASIVRTKESIKEQLQEEVSESSDEEGCDEDSLFELHRKMATSPVPMPTRRLYAPRRMANHKRDYELAARFAEATAHRIRPFVEGGDKKHHLVMPPPSLSQRVTRKIGKRVRQSRVEVLYKVPTPMPFENFRVPLRSPTPPLISSPSPVYAQPMCKRRKIRVVGSGSSLVSLNDSQEGEQKIRRGLSAVNLEDANTLLMKTPVVYGQPETSVPSASTSFYPFGFLGSL